MDNGDQTLAYKHHKQNNDASWEASKYVYMLLLNKFLVRLQRWYIDMVP